MTGAENPGCKSSGWWRRWFVEPVRKQLTQGISPDKLAWTISAALVLGIFPIMGSTSFLCLIAGWVFKMNQAVLQAFNALMYPLHLALILVFIRTGEELFGARPIAFSVSQLLTRFKDSPMQFARDFGLAALQGISAWLLVAPFLALLVKFSIAPVLRGFAKKLNETGGALP